ncbi:hypothetical protein ACQEU3_41385 [Spirillospora sp. CA-253888]
MIERASLTIGPEYRAVGVAFEATPPAAGFFLAGSSSPIPHPVSITPERAAAEQSAGRRRVTCHIVNPLIASANHQVAVLHARLPRGPLSLRETGKRSTGAHITLGFANANSQGIVKKDQHPLLTASGQRHADAPITGHRARRARTGGEATRAVGA